MSSGHFSRRTNMAHKLRTPQTVTPETTIFRFTLEEIHDADHEMFGFCLACREIRECTEPDAENYSCEVCGQNAVRQRRAEKWVPVFGDAARQSKTRPHWILIAGLVE